MLSATFVTVGTVELYELVLVPYVMVEPLGTPVCVPPLQVNALPSYVLLLPANDAFIVALVTEHLNEPVLVVKLLPVT